MNISSTHKKNKAAGFGALCRWIWRRLAWVMAACGVVVMPCHGLNTSETFPDLRSFGLEGQIPETKGKVVLVDFFASWCIPCHASFPAMQELVKKFPAKDFVIIAVNVDDKKSDMDDFLKKHPATFAIVRDGAKKLVSTVKVSTMPSSYVLDKNGVVRNVHSGFKGEETKKQYIAEIEALLK